MVLIRSTLAALAILAAGCTTVPERMQVDASIAPDCAFAVEQRTAAGFVLEIAARPYFFIPQPDAATLAGRDCFATVAAELARRDGRRAAPPSIADMSVTSSRNMDGRYLVTVVGAVRYAPP